MKILIVDDEINIRESMSNFIAKLDLGFECIEIAESGNDGLDKALKLKPDIIVSDIVIPEFNGLELLNKVKYHLPKCKYIMISGHDDVEYFKESIKLDVIDYLLKPIKPTELKNALIKCIEIINKEKKHLLLTKELKKYIYDNSPIMKNHYLKMLFSNSNISDIQLNQMRLIDFKLCDSNNIILSNILVNMNNIKHTYESDYYVFESQMTIDETLKEQSKKWNLNYYNIWEDTGSAIIVFYGMKKSITKNKILSFYEEIIGILKKINIQVFISISNNIEKIKDIKMHYEKIKRSNKNILLTGYNNVIFSSDTYMLEYEEHSYSKEFNKLLEKYNLRNCDDVSNVDLDTIKMDIAIEILIYINKYCKDNGIESIIDYSKLFNLSTISEFDKFYYDNWKTIENILINRRVTRTEYIINSIVNYIDEFYTQNIGVSTIADYINISPNYCGAIFKEQKDEKINEYINKVRIEKACELIKNTDYSISDISNMVGYVSNGYFTKLFKKQIGYTPSEYRDKLVNIKCEL